MFAVIASALIGTACLGLQFGKPSSDQAVIELSYCNPVNPPKLCLVSFGLDSNNRMLINFVNPEPSTFPFYLKVQRAETSSRYDCQAIVSAPTEVFCTGEPAGLGDSVDIELYSSKGGVLIAKGTFVIDAFALATPFTISGTALYTQSPFDTAMPPTAFLPSATAVIQTSIFPTVTPVISTAFLPTATRATPTPIEYPNP